MSQLMNRTMTDAAVSGATPTTEASRRLRIAANASLVYPVIFLAVLHGQWLLSWAVLGHMPRVSIDDPQDIDGASWMQSVTLVAMCGVLPVAACALVLNVWHVADARRGWAAMLGRVVALAAFLFAAFACMRWDPWRVAEWWID